MDGVIIIGPGSINVPGVTSTANKIRRTEDSLHRVVREGVRQNNIFIREAPRPLPQGPRDVELNYNVYRYLGIIQTMVIDKKNNQVIREIPSSGYLEFVRRFRALNTAQIGRRINLLV
jgi:hypothetical protein